MDSSRPKLESASSSPAPAQTGAGIRRDRPLMTFQEMIVRADSDRRNGYLAPGHFGDRGEHHANIASDIPLLPVIRLYYGLFDNPVIPLDDILYESTKTKRATSTPADKPIKIANAPNVGDYDYDAERSDNKPPGGAESEFHHNKDIKSENQSPEPCDQPMNDDDGDAEEMRSLHEELPGGPELRIRDPEDLDAENEFPKPYDQPIVQQVFLMPRPARNVNVRWRDEGRPLVTFSQMAYDAIVASGNSPLNVKEIFDAMEDKYPYYKSEGFVKCRSSVFHGVKDHKCFEAAKVGDPRVPAGASWNSARWTIAHLKAEPRLISHTALIYQQLLKAPASILTWDEIRTRLQAIYPVYFKTSMCNSLHQALHLRRRIDTHENFFLHMGEYFSINVNFELQTRHNTVDLIWSGERVPYNIQLDSYYRWLWERNNSTEAISESQRTGLIIWAAAKGAAHEGLSLARHEQEVLKLAAENQAELEYEEMLDLAEDEEMLDLADDY